MGIIELPETRKPTSYSQGTLGSQSDLFHILPWKESALWLAVLTGLTIAVSTVFWASYYSTLVIPYDQMGLSSGLFLSRSLVPIMLIFILLFSSACFFFEIMLIYLEFSDVLDSSNGISFKHLNPAIVVLGMEVFFHLTITYSVLNYTGYRYLLLNLFVSSATLGMVFAILRIVYRKGRTKARWGVSLGLGNVLISIAVVSALYWSVEWMNTAGSTEAMAVVWGESPRSIDIFYMYKGDASKSGNVARVVLMSERDIYVIDYITRQEDGRVTWNTRVLSRDDLELTAFERSGVWTIGGNELELPTPYGTPVPT